MSAHFFAGSTTVDPYDYGESAIVDPFYAINVVHMQYFCSRCALSEAIGKTASVAVNYFVSKGYCLSEASLAFAGIIPREKRQVFPFRRESGPDAGGKLCTQLVFTAIVSIVSIVYTKYTKTAHTANAIRAVISITYHGAIIASIS